jgi:hypothetical protein
MAHHLTATAVLLFAGLTAMAQTPSYPTELRGYKVERAVVEIKKKQKKTGSGPAGENAVDPDTLIQFGDPQLASVSPLSIGLEIPMIIAPVQQKGHVEFLLFEEMVVNGTTVHIDEYHHSFDLPNKERFTLREPLKFYIYLPSAVLAAIGEWNNSKETWLVTGRVYVFGKFKKSVFNFKRCIPVELKFMMRNPLQK